ncbi:hypothetical protein YC2023_027890 [Brassica napus]
MLVLLQERYPISIATKFCSCSFDEPLLCRGNSKHTTKHVQLNIKLIFFSYEIRGIRKKNIVACWQHMRDIEGVWKSEKAGSKGLMQLLERERLQILASRKELKLLVTLTYINQIIDTKTLVTSWFID